MQAELIQGILNATKFSKEELDTFLKLGTAKRIAKKSLLAKPKVRVNKAYFVIDGVARHYVLKDGQQFTKNFIVSPRFMLPSLTNFFLATPSLLYCEALDDMSVIEWSRADVYNFADRCPKMYRFLLKSVVNAFNSKEMKEIALHQLKAEARYHNFLEEFPGLINKIPAQYIASYLGIRPETLSRIRSKRIS